jgi:diguanylate cyclase (GGDEF)-like protein
VVADRIRQRIEAAAHDVGSAAPIKVTLSLGCATFPTTAQGSAAEVLAAADRALYGAKRGGRNRVVAYPVPADAAVPAPDGRQVA